MHLKRGSSSEKNKVVQLKQFATSILRLACRLYPFQHGRFRILTQIYFGALAPPSSTWIRAELRGGITMRLDVSEFLQAHLYLFGSYELPTVRFIERFVQPNFVLIDVGAQIGYLTLVMATSANRSARVISFEPQSSNVERFQENMRLNNVTNVELITAAVSSASGTIRLYLSTDNNAGTHSTISSDPNVGADFEEVPATTLDETVDAMGLSAVDLVKVDVEGAELEVIEGAINTIASLKPTFIIELSEAIQQSRGYSTVQFKSMMSANGYASYLIRDNGTLEPVGSNVTHVMDNVVFVHSERLSHIAGLTHRA